MSYCLQKNYEETGSIDFYQILTPEHLVSEELRSLRGEFGKHPGITKAIIAYVERYYYSNMSQLISQWAMSCKQCVRES